MGFELGFFKDKKLSADYIDWLVDEQSVDISRHFSKLWDYYTNRMLDNIGFGGEASGSGRCYFQAQEYGLPVRITGKLYSANGGVFGSRSVGDIERKEVVIENDIAWRVNAGVDFLFGKGISFASRAPNSNKRTEIESILKAVFAASGGIGASPARVWLAYLAVD